MGKGVSRRGSFAALPVLIFAFVLIVSNAVFSAVSCGQSTFGAIVGVLKDPGQGAVANAELTLVNLDDRSERCLYDVRVPRLGKVAYRSGEQRRFEIGDTDDRQFRGKLVAIRVHSG